MRNDDSHDPSEVITDPWNPVFDEVEVAMKEQRKRRASSESPRRVELPWDETPAVDPRQQALDLFKDMMKDAAKEAAKEALTAKAAPSKPFEAIWEWWKPLYLPGLKSKDSFEGRVRKHLLPVIKSMTSETLTLPVLDELWLKLDKHAGHGGALGPQTLNHLRNHGRRIIRNAMDGGLWPESAGNPFAKLKKRKVKTRKPMMANEEAADFIFFGGDVYRNIFATALYLAMRKNEIRKLEVSDVDLVKKRIRIYSSKVDEERFMPIPEELVPYLSDAIAKTKGKYVFPRKDGVQMRRPDEHWEKAVLAALGRAGIVTAWRHKCRRNSLKKNGVRCDGYVEEAADNNPRRCPKCRVRLWAIPIPRKITFHGLRRISNTLHQNSGCHRKVAQLLLGHDLGSLTTTESVYLEFSEDDMRRELNKLSLKRKTPPPPPPVPDESDSSEGEDRADDGGSTAEPDGVGLRSRRPVVRIHYRAQEAVDLPPLLTVGEVAKYLRVSKPTIFRLLESGDLQHIRVGAQIRISSEVFAKYLRRMRGGK